VFKQPEQLSNPFDMSSAPKAEPKPVAQASFQMVDMVPEQKPAPAKKI